ncbi:subunit 21 of mediator complex protein [Ceratobasidium sp. AG-Ba]|nr:subunit 21 of mediator complex protein [Ceratobasidium sp. AG-Ba]QRV91648.1 subunit 21 of mediator complex protein [Ceratobasidium sp. AG-Ba]QRW05715.1 subunit 21 of mediator complex protein [Ceratobasidium sp. AG-Ba]
MDKLTQLHDAIESLLTIMSSSIVYLVTRNSFRQVNPDIPVTVTRPPDREDPPDVFEANKRELVNDLITKAKQIEFLIKSLPPPEPEAEQATRLLSLEAEMKLANEEYKLALARAQRLHVQVGDALQVMLSDLETPDGKKAGNS